MVDECDVYKRKGYQPTPGTLIDILRQGVFHLDVARHVHAHHVEKASEISLLLRI